MKILVFSDSHHALRSMRGAIELENPDYAIHLGDLERDAELLSQEYPQLPIAQVPGNCDVWPTQPLQKLVTYGQTRILMSHGHIWGVKGTLNNAIAAGRGSAAHILLFGHTHVPYCQQLEDGLWVMNPGSARDGCYGRILLEDSSIICTLHRD